MKHDNLTYKGYQAEIEIDLEDQVLIGKVNNTQIDISFHASSVAQLQKEFKEAIDTYLEYCSKQKISPERGYSGVFNLRISPELHKRMAELARKERISLNEFVNDTLEKAVSSTGTINTPTHQRIKELPNAPGKTITVSWVSSNEQQFPEESYQYAGALPRSGPLNS